MRQTRIAHFIAALLAAGLTVALVGCGKDGGSAGKPSAQTQSPPTTQPDAASPLDQILTAWHQGNHAVAVQRFIETDWKSGLHLSPGAALSHRESELPGMSQAVLDNLMAEVSAQLGDLKQLGGAVRDKGQTVASTDPALARRCFASLNDCGAALAQPDGMKIVQLVGQTLRKMAAAESAKLATQ